MTSVTTASWHAMRDNQTTYNPIHLVLESLSSGDRSIATAAQIRIDAIIAVQIYLCELGSAADDGDS